MVRRRCGLFCNTKNLREFVSLPGKSPKTPLSRIGAEAGPFLDRKLERPEIHKTSDICSHHLENEPFALFQIQQIAGEQVFVPTIARMFGKNTRNEIQLDVVERGKRHARTRLITIPRRR